MKLDLGCGQAPREGFEGVDLWEGAQHQHDLLQPWPWPDNSIEELSSSHFIEHIPTHWSQQGKDLLCWFFDEAWRVIKPGGVFLLQWPALQSVRAFQDPTHRRYIPLETLNYLNAEWRQAVGISHYNIACNWGIVRSGHTLDGGYVVGTKDTLGNEYFQNHWNIAVDCYAELKAIK